MIAAATLLSACHMFSGVANCHRPQEYQRAAQWRR